MNSLTLRPGARSGAVIAPSSKSHAHRLLTCAALGSEKVNIYCSDISDDISATARCLDSLCADISAPADGILSVAPRTKPSFGVKRLPCGESGSTLRFLIPVCGALGESAVFEMSGRLPQRPLSPLDELLRAHGMIIRPKGSELFCSGRLTPGTFEITGSVSSQFISGLLFALPLLDGDSSIVITGKTESSAYIAMTENALRSSGIRLDRRENGFFVPGGQTYALPDGCAAEGDFSNAAFFLCIGALSDRGVTVNGLPCGTLQGDSAVIDILRRFGAEIICEEQGITVRKGRLRGCLIDASPIPDLIPVLSVVAAAAEGDTHIINAGRLRLKESDRLSSVTSLLRSLGADVTELSDGLIIHSTGALSGGTADSLGDHRIAMSAAVAACICSSSVTITDSKCVNKSFPRFWECFDRLEVL